MIIKIIILLIIIAVVLRFTLFRNKSKVDKIDTSVYEGRLFTPMELDIIESINLYRLENKLSHVYINGYMAHLCQRHVEYCIEKGRMSHDNFPMRASNIMNELDGKPVGEVLSFGYRNGEAVVEAWKRSEGHNKQLLIPEHTRIGVYVKRHNDKNYIAVLLAGIK